MEELVTALKGDGSSPHLVTNLILKDCGIAGGLENTKQHIRFLSESNLTHCNFSCLEYRCCSAKYHLCVCVKLCLCGLFSNVSQVSCHFGRFSGNRHDHHPP
jgi:hypothetical protein